MHPTRHSARILSRATAALHRIQRQLQTARNQLCSLERQILGLRTNKDSLIQEINRLRAGLESLQREVLYLEDTGSLSSSNIDPDLSPDLACQQG